MRSYLGELMRRHQRLDRMIDNRKSVKWQEDLKQLKRLRLRLKDKIAALKRRTLPAG